MLRGEMQEATAMLRGEMHGLESSLRGEMQSLRTEVHVGFADMRTEFAERTNREIKWLVTFAVAWTTVLVTLVRLIP